MFSEHVQSRAAGTTRQQTRQQARQATETTVLATAEKLFTTTGFHNTTIRAIATAAGLSTGTIMSVGDKNTLLIKIFDEKIAKIHRERAENFTITDPTPETAFHRTITPFLQAYDTHQDLARTYFAILVAGSHNSTIFDELAAQLKAEFGAIITHFRTHPDPESAAHALYLGFLGVLVVWAGNPNEDPHHHLNNYATTFFSASQGAP